MYERSTREVTLDALPALLLAAMREHANAHQLELVAHARVWLTHSVNPPASGFLGTLFGRRANPVDPDAEHDSAIVLLPTHLLVVTSGARAGTSASSLPLLSASLAPAPTAAAALGVTSPADGLWIEGFPGSAGRPGMRFVGLGAPAGAECARVVEEAIRAAKRG